MILPNQTKTAVKPKGNDRRLPQNYREEKSAWMRGGLNKGGRASEKT